MIYIYVVNILQAINSLVLYINEVKVFETCSTDFNLFDRWYNNLHQLSNNLDELNSLVASETGSILGTPGTGYHDNHLVGATESSGYHYLSLKSLFPHLLSNINTRYVYSIRLDIQLASDLTGRVHSAVGNVNTCFSIQYLSLRIEEQKHSTLVQQVPLGQNLMLSCNKWFQRTYAMPFSAQTSVLFPFPT